MVRVAPKGFNDSIELFFCADWLFSRIGVFEIGIQSIPDSWAFRTSVNLFFAPNFRRRLVVWFLTV